MSKANALKIVFAPVLAALTLAAADTAAAQYGRPPPPPYAGGPMGSNAQRPHWYFGIEGQGFFIMKQVTDSAGYMGQGGGGNFFAGYRIGPNIALEFNLGITYHSEDRGPFRLLDALFLLTPTVDVKVHLGSSGRLQPYLQAGVGYAYLGATYPEGIGCDIGCDTTFAQGPLFQFGGGFDYWMTPFVTLGTRLLYRAMYFSESAYGDTRSARGPSNFINGLVFGINGVFHFH